MGGLKMTETAISNEDTREIVRERIGNILEDYSNVFKNAYTVGLAIDAILEIPNLAIIDRDAELPVYFPEEFNQEYIRGWEQNANDMLNEGWVKECL